MSAIHLFHLAEERLSLHFIHQPESFQYYMNELSDVRLNTATYQAVIDSLLHMSRHGLALNKAALVYELRQRLIEEVVDQLFKTPIVSFTKEELLLAIAQVKEGYLLNSFYELGLQLTEMAKQPGMQASSLYKAAEQQLKHLFSVQNGHQLKSMNDLIAELWQPDEPPVEWFLPDLTNQLGGLQKGELVVLGARPAMGKTMLLLHQVLHASLKLRKPVLFLSMELNEKKIMRLLISILSGRSAFSYNSSFSDECLPDEVKEVAAVLQDAPLHIFSVGALHIFDLKKELERYKENLGIELVVIDYLQLVRGNKKGYNREQEIGLVTNVLKDLARELDIIILVAAALSRVDDGKPGASAPKLTDLRESGSIEASADKVLFLHRPEYYGVQKLKNGMSTRGYVEVHMAKNRLGPTATCAISFLMDKLQYQSYVPVPYVKEKSGLNYDNRMMELEEKFVPPPL